MAFIQSTAAAVAEVVDIDLNWPHAYIISQGTGGQEHTYARICHIAGEADISVVLPLLGTNPVASPSITLWFKLGLLHSRLLMPGKYQCNDYVMVAVSIHDILSSFTFAAPSRHW